MLFIAHLENASNIYFSAQSGEPNYIDAISVILDNASKNITKSPFEINATVTTLKWCGAYIFLVVFTIYYLKSIEKKTAFGKEKGSAEWASIKDEKKYYDKKSSENNMILTNTVQMSMNTRQHRKNNNILIIGSTGAGKSRFFAKPNLMQANCSFVVTDPKGELLRDTADMFEKLGYQVKVFNLKEPEYSCCYNPFVYIRNDDEVFILVNQLIKNTTAKEKGGGDAFWEKAETTLIEALFFFLLHPISIDDYYEYTSTDTISLQDAAYQGALDEGRFLELKGAVESGSFDSSSFYQNNIDESKIYSEEYAWDEATIDEWQHVTTAKIHTDRLAIFDYVNSKYRESESDTQYIKNLDELDENETSEPKKVKQYSNYEIKNDLLDLWAKLQFLSLRVYNKDNFDKPIFDLMGDSVTAYDYIDWKKEVIKITGTKTYKDEDNDTRVEEYDQTYNVYDTNVRFDCYADDVKAYQDVFKDDSRIVDVANTNTYNGYDLYISQYWSMSSGRQSEKYYIQDTDELGEDWGWRTSNPNECYKISQWYWNNDVYECAFEGFITVQEFNEKVNSGAFKLWHYEIDDSEEYYFNNSKDALSDNTQLFRKVNIFDGDNNIVQDGYINVPIYEERQNEISSHADLYAFANDMPIDSWYGGMYRWTHYYEQIYYCIEAHKSIPLRYYLERDLEHAMSRSDRPQEENETSVQMYEALRDFDANETSAFIGNIFDDKIVSLKRENGYRHAKEASGRNADIMMFNDDKYKWNHLEVYSESGWEVYAPMSGELSIGKLPSFYRSIIGEEEDTSDYLIIGGTKEWEVPKDKSAWKKFKENVSNLFTGGEGGDTPNYRQQCLYIKLSDIALKDKLKDEINEKGYATIISGIVLGTCSGETMQLIPTYNSWENGEMYAEPYDLGVYMSETAATISALSDRRLDRESLGYEILSCAEKYRFYSYYKDIYYMGNEATSFSSAGLVKHVLNKISESEKNVFETDVTTISSEKDLKKRSKITYSPQTGDLIFLEKNGEIKYVGFVADAKNHTMFLQEDAYAEYAHYANWKHSEWKDYNITFGKLELKEEKIK